MFTRKRTAITEKFSDVVNKQTIKKYKLLILAVLLSLAFSLYNLSQNYLFQDVCGDCFLYLGTAKYGHENPTIATIRTPLIAYIILPEIHAARIEYAIFMAASVTFLYMITLKITENHKKAFLASLIFGTSACMVTTTTTSIFLETPSMMFFLVSLYFAMKTKRDSELSGLLSGIFIGLSFVFRQFVILLLPSMFYTIYRTNSKKGSLNFMLGFFLVAVVLEMIVSHIFFESSIYPPLEFFKSWIFEKIRENPEVVAQTGTVLYYINHLFITFPVALLLAAAGIISSLLIEKKNKGDFLIIIAMTLSILLPFSILPPKEYRWVISSVPLICIIASESLDLRKLIKFDENILFFIVSLLIVSYNFLSLVQTRYPIAEYGKIDWSLVRQELEGRRCITNISDRTSYFTKVLCDDVFTNDRELLNLSHTTLIESKIGVLEEYERIVILSFDEEWIDMKNVALRYTYFYYPEPYFNELKRWSDENLNLIYSKDIGYATFNLYST